MARFFLILAALASIASSQRPSNTSICDYYTGKILGNNTAANQKLLQTLLINTVVLGNYTTPNTGVSVAGFASPAVYNGTNVALLPFFTGALLSTNGGGDVGISKLFLDDGGAAPLQKNMSSNGNVTSVQDHLLTHIYEYFGTLLGCTLQGGNDFPAYQGVTSMYEVHRFMDLDKYQMGFFIEQCALSASSLGFAPPDVSIFYNTLQALFNTRCAPATIVPGIQETPELQSCCIADNCPLDPNANCGAYPDDAVAIIPQNATISSTESPTNSSTGGPKASGVTSGAGRSGGMTNMLELVVEAGIVFAMIAI